MNVSPRSQVYSLMLAFIALGAIAGWLVGTTTIILATITSLLLAFLPVPVIINRIMLPRSDLHTLPSAAAAYTGTTVKTSVLRLAGNWFFFAGLATTGLLVIRPAAGITLSDSMFFISLVFVIIDNVLSKRRFSLQLPHPMLLGILLFSFGALISSVASGSPLVSIAESGKFVFILLIWIPLGIEVLRDLKTITTASAVWVTSIAISSLGAILQRYASVDIPGAMEHYGRFSGVTGHVSDLGGMTSIALIPALALLLRALPNLIRSIYFAVCIGLIVAGLLLSGSVAGMVTVAVGFFVYALVLGKKALIVIFLSIVSLYFADLRWGFIDYLFSRPADRLIYVTGVQGNTDASLWVRVETYRDAWQSILNNPIIGTGLKPGGTLTESGFAVHNVILQPWFEAGLLGGLGMLLILMTTLVLSIRNLNLTERGKIRTWLGAISCSVIVFFIFAQTGPILYQRYAWMPVMFLLSYDRLLKTSLRTRSDGRV